MYEIQNYNIVKQNIIDWCNSNQGFIDTLLTILTICISIIALIMSIRSTTYQVKVSLLRQRISFMDELDKYVMRFMASPEYRDSNSNFFEKNSKVYVEALFNGKIKNYMSELEKKCSSMQNLYGDIDRAEKAGKCKGRTVLEINKEIDAIYAEAKKEYQEIKEYFFKKYFKIY